MITGIVIENFKSVRDRIELELRPITLLFGANGAGKSTIVEAIELLEQLLLDRHHRRGKSLTRRVEERVGSVREAVFGQVAKPITLGITITSEESWFDYFRELTVYDSGYDHENNQIDASCRIPSSTSGSLLGGDEVRSISVELTLGESFGVCDGALSPIAQTTQLVIGVNERWLMRLEKTNESFDSTEKIAWHVDTDHPVFDNSVVRVGERTFYVRLPNIIPRDNEPPILAAFCENLDDGALAVSLNLAVAATLSAIEEELATFQRIGPLRVVPPNHFQPKSHPSREDWLVGLAAWDQLGFASDDELARINQWLGPENLDTGVEIVRRIMISLDDVEALLKLKETDPARFAVELFQIHSLGQREIKLRPISTKYGGQFESKALLSPSQVGTGVSQIIPVLVACVSRQSLLLAIAQPELHLHPRLQVKLADLFINCMMEQALGDKPNRLLVETHSEHLILRLLRRIRETSNGTPTDGCALMSEDLAVYHVRSEGGASHIRRINVDKHGEFVEPWPDDFFEIDFYERFGHDR